MTVTSNRGSYLGLPFARLLSRVQVENRHFRLMYSDCKSRGGSPSNINAIYTSLKSTVSGVQWRTILSLTVHVCLHSRSRYCLPNLRNREIPWKLQLTTVQGHPSLSTSV